MEYFSALWQHGVALMSGVASVLTLLGLRIGRRVFKPISRWSELPDILLIAVGLVCLFVAGYQAWNDKQKELVKLQERLRTPDLTGVELTALSATMNGHPIIVMAGAIQNPVGPPSGAINWKMYVKLPNGAVVNGTPRFPPSEDLVIPVPKMHSTIKLRHGEYWPNVTTQPILAGGLASGWFLSVFEGSDIELFRKKKATLVVEFNDVVSGHKHSACFSLGQQTVKPEDMALYK